MLKLITFSLLFWLARDLSEDEYAEFGLLYSMQIGIIALSISGIIETVTGFLKFDSINSRDKLVFNSKIVFLLYFIVVIIALTAYNHLFLDTNLVYFIVIYCSLILAYCSIQYQLLRINEEHIKSIIFSFLIPLLGFIGAFIMYYNFRNYAYYYYGTAIGLTFSFITSVILRRSEFLIEGELVKDIIYKSAPYIIVAFVGWCSGYGNSFIIDYFLDRESVAKYTFLLTLGSSVLVIATSLNQVWAPRVYKFISISELDKVEKESSEFYGKMSLYIACFSSFILILYPYILDFIGGNLINYKGYSFELMLILLSYVTLTTWWNSYNYMLYYGQGKLVLKVIIISSSLGLSTWLILIYCLKDFGVYLGFLFQVMLRSLVINFYSKSMYSVNFDWRYLVASYFILIGTYIIQTLV